MITNSIISSISLIFNDSWMAHMGSRVYRTAIKALEGLFGGAFSPVAPYSGKRLYQLVDTYRQSNRDKTSYDRARIHYASGIIKALEGERDPFEKTRRAKSILNTHIMGLSILQAKDKASLSEHISYTLLPSLIDEFGKKMATSSIVALHELDNIAASRHDINSLYRNIALQQEEFDLFVQALDQLQSGISKDILINELLLSRNRNLSKTAKDKIAEILQSKNYIDIKLHKKLQTIKLVRGHNHEVEFDRSSIISQLHENRNNQLQALCHRGSSIFFESDELDNISLKSEGSIDSKDSSPEEKTQSTSATPSVGEAINAPIGISNNQLNCWYNSALQILRGTPIYRDILQHRNKFARDFPNIFASFDLYQRASVNKIMHSENFSKSNIVNIDSYLANIRKEAHYNLDKEFKETEIAQEDSQYFLYTLLNKLSIPIVQQTWLPGEEIPSIEERHLLLEKPAPSQLVDNPNIVSIKIDLKTLFAENDHQLYGIIFHVGGDYSRGRDFNRGHYFAAVKMNGSWYLCNDSRVTETSETEVEDLIQKNKALLIASRTRLDHIESDVD